MIAPDGTLSIQKTAKVLLSEGFDTGEKKLYGWLRCRGYLDCANIAKTVFIKSGLFKVRRGSFQRSENTEKEMYVRTFITEKGLTKIKSELNIVTPKAPSIPEYIYSGLGPWDDINVFDRITG